MALVVAAGGVAIALSQTGGGAGPARNPAQAHTVGSIPTGPPTPPGGWSVVYADAFGAPIGSAAGEDNTWFPNNCSERGNCAGFNENEREVMNPSAVSQGSDGLKLTCTYTAAAQSPGDKHFVCGTLRGLSEGLAGYSFFRWSPGKGQTLAFQAVAKLPVNTGDADPAWWSNGPPWNDTEIDFFEAYGAGSQHTVGWKTDSLYTAWFAPPLIRGTKVGFATDPSAGFHTYTFELKPNNTYSVWIDGALQPWASDVGPAKPDLAAKDSLVLSYGLRQCQCESGFTGGTREFDVRSVSVYEDRRHDGVGVENRGIAPGTTVR